MRRSMAAIWRRTGAGGKPCRRIFQPPPAGVRPTTGSQIAFPVLADEIDTEAVMRLLGHQQEILGLDVPVRHSQLMDVVETYREIASGLVEVYLSSQTARMNEVMKVLTIISTIFIPLGFLAGLWGMNFDHDSIFGMPELHWKYGYPAALGIMLAVALSLLWFFRRKGWIGGNGDGGDRDG